MKCLRKPPAARAKCLRALPAHKPTRDVESTLGEEGLAARWVLQRPDVAWFNDRGPYGGGSNTAASWTAAVDADDRPFGDRRRAEALLAQVNAGFGGDLLKALTQYPLVATDTGHLLDGWHRLYLWVKSGLPGGPPTLVMVPGRGGLGSAPNRSLTFYRGTVPGATERIRTGNSEWDSYLFVTDTPEGARWYGQNIETVTLKPSAKVLFEGSRGFPRPHHGENTLQWASRVAHDAKTRGYDAVHFDRQTDIGTPILNLAAIESRKPLNEGLDRQMTVPGKGGLRGLSTQNIIAYHGTDAVFDRFAKSKARWGSFGRGFYFTDTPAEAAKYGKHLMRVRLTIARPASLADVNAAASDTAKLARRGFDGVVHRSSISGLTTYVVFRPEQVEVLPAEGLGKVSDLCTGKQVAPSVFDHTCVLSPAQRKEGHTLRVEIGPSGNYVRASLHHESAPHDKQLRQGEVGFVSGVKSGETFIIGESFLTESFRGRGLGTSLYEALYARAQVMGAKAVAGTAHSTPASMLHRKMAEKHGLKYQPVPNYGPEAAWETKREWLAAPSGAYDEKWQAYQFPLNGVGTRVPVSEVLAFYAKVSPSQHLADRIKTHSEWDLTRINTAHLRIDPGHDAAKASSYARLKSRPPPIIVIPGTLEWEVLDGNHRAAAALESGKRTISAYVPARSTGPLSVRRASVGLRGLGEAPVAQNPREQAYVDFVGAVRHVWKNAEFVLPVVTMLSDEPTTHPDGFQPFASVTFNPQGIWANGPSLLRRAPQYTLRVSDRFLALPAEQRQKVLIHEAVHLGYPKHDAEFRALCREKGGTVSERALDDPGIKAEKKIGSRFQVQRTFQDEKEAKKWATEQQRAEPGSRWRLSLGGVGGPRGYYETDRMTMEEKLYGPIQSWKHYPDSDRKEPLLAAYASLTPGEKLALEASVRAAFLREHGGEEAVLYRYKSHLDDPRGKSLTAEKPPSSFKQASFRIRPEQVMVHYGQNEFPLGAGIFKHEKEVILRPDGPVPERLSGLGATKAACPSWDFDPNVRSSIWVRPDGCAIDAGGDHRAWAREHLKTNDGYAAMLELLNQGWLRFHVADAQLNTHMTKVPNAAQVRTLERYARYPGVTIGMADVEYGGQMRYLPNTDGRVTAGRITAFAKKYLA